MKVIINGVNNQKLLWVEVCLVFILGFLFTTGAIAQEVAPRQQTESPYFLIKGGDPQVDQLPLKDTQVEAYVSGVIADVVVVQQYSNEGSRPIEAKYVFPGSTRAAVYAMNIRIGDRLITASIREKQQARIEYEAAKSEGKTAALLEEHLPNVFQMNVANILPGDDIRVELRYTETLVPQSGNYQFMFPTVVGPRFNSPSAETQISRNNAQAVSQPYLHAGEASPTNFGLKVTINAPMEIQEVRSPSHEIDVTTEGLRRAIVQLRPNTNINNRDVIVDYRLAGDKIASGIMLYEGQDENFFLAMIEPPKAVNTGIINPRDYLFVVDISGSMGGYPLDTAKQVLNELIGGLRPSDTFNVMLFSGSSSMLAPRSLPATRANIDNAIGMLSTYYGSGSTELIPALRQVYAQPKPADVSRTIVVVTDGYVSVEREAFELIRNNLDKANLFAIGIGSSVNRHLIEGMARAGQGEPFIITNANQAPAEATRFRQMIASPVLTSVRAHFDGLDVYDVEPVKLPDVLSERPVVLYGKWRGDAQGKLIIEGQSATGAYRQELPVADAVATNVAALRYLWARSRIDALSDQESLEGGDEYSQKIKELGLKYSLLTPYTSFIAVDKVVRVKDPADTDSVNQPSPMPEGVSDMAIGAEVPGTPEPATWAAMLLVMSLMAGMWWVRRRKQLS